MKKVNSNMQNITANLAKLNFQN